MAREKKEEKTILDNPAVEIFLLIVVIYSLFMDDIRLAFLPKSADDPLSVITIVIMVIFTVEIVYSCFVIKGYRWSFYFWLDVISTLTLLFDLSWIFDLMTGERAQEAESFAKTARATRLTRAVRVVRIIRIIRVVKLYK